MVGEASGHRRWGREHVAAVGAAQRLARFQRQMVVQRDEGVLERDARVGMSVHVAGRNRAQSQAARARDKQRIAFAVTGEKRSLQLDAQTLGSKCLEEQA
jgi:hypothetical protein